MLLKYNASIDSKDSNGWTALHYASYYGNGPIAKLLLENNANPNANAKYSTDLNSTSNYLTPLLLAVKNNSLETVQILLASGAFVDAEDSKEMTSLHWAALQGIYEIFKILIEDGANCKKVSKNLLEENYPSYTILHWAAKGYGNDTKIAEYSIQNGVDINLQQIDGFTALHFAAKHNKTKLFQFLLENGAHMNITTNYQ